MLNGKVIISHLIPGLIKKIFCKMSQYFPKLREPFEGNINIKVDLCNYAIKIGLKKVTGIYVSNLALKSNLAKLKTEVDKIDVDKWRTVPVDLNKLSNVANNDVAKKIVHDRLFAKVNNIDTSGFVLKSKYNTDKSDLEKKISDADKNIPDTNRRVTKTDYNDKTYGHRRQNT